MLRRRPQPTIATIALLLCALLSTFIQGQSQQNAAPPAPTDEDFINPETATLELYVGPWSVLEKHLNRSGEVVATVEGSEDVAWILDRRAIERTYITKAASNVYRAKGVLAWDDVQKAYRGIWLDNASTHGPKNVTGKWQPAKQTMIFTLKTQDSDGAVVEYKVIEHFIDPEHREAVTYRVDGSEVIKLLEVRYTRTIPCPGKLRVIFDGLENAPPG